MITRIDEIADGIFRISTFIKDVAPPAGFTFNQFLIRDDEPLLFHTGMRGLFNTVIDAAAKVIPIEDLRWITFGHFEADECGAMNNWLARCPNAQIAHSRVGCDVSIGDLADRPPRALDDGEVIETGARRLRYFYTPHVPHGWDAGVLFEETTRTMLCGDLFTHAGDGPPVVTSDILGPAMAADEMFQAEAVTPQSGPTIRRLAATRPETLALMHGSSWRGDGQDMLEQLAAHFERRLQAGAAA